MVIGLTKFSMSKKLYEGCLVGKKSKNDLKSYLPMRSSCILEVVHSDVCGPFEDHTIYGNKYLISFIDKHNEKLWAYNTKVKCLEYSKSKILVENQNEKKIKVLKTDGGGKYTSKVFDEFCINHGIDYEVTTSYTPKYNGLYEIRNKSILEMTKFILKQKSMPN